MKLTHLLVSASVLAVTSAPVFAEGNTIFSGNSGIKLTFSGQVNRGVLLSDDGVDTETFFVDNDNSSTRFRIIAEGDINAGLRAGLNIEIEAETNSTAVVSQDNRNPDSSDFLNERKLEFYLEGDSFGRISVGQGDTASNSSAEVDLSGTAVVGYSGIADLGGGLQFRDEDENLSGVRVGQTFTNLDGLSRQDRVRYDTPSLNGLVLSASAGVAGGDFDGEEIYDIAARYKGDFGAYKFDSAIAFAVAPNDDEIVDGSASVLHESGVSLTLAGGSVDRDDDADDRDTVFGYIKLGYETEGLTSMGSTAFAIDYSYNEDVALEDDESTSYGLFAVQKVDAINSELYLGVRNYELDRTGEDFDDIVAVLAGARIRF